MTETLTPDAPGADPPSPDAEPPSPPPETEGGVGAAVVRRARRGWERFAAMPVEGYVSLVVVAGCVLFTFVQLGPGNLFADTTPAGGDMGAHVWGPAFLRDELLPQFRLTGWTPDWYAGFPAYQFYMVVPSLAIALLSFVLPYGIAFKLVTVSGVLTLPIAAWAFGRLTRLPFPIAPLLAVAATWFLFDISFSIYGGNIASTLAGEFAFSISLSFAVLYLGVLGRGLEDGRHRFAAAGLLAMVALCHLIPLFFALAGTVIWFVLQPAVARLKYLASVLSVGGLLSAFWVVPFYLRHGYMNDMGWEKKTDYANFLFSRDELDSQLIDSPGIRWVLALAAVGALMAVVYGITERRRGAVFWLVMAVVAAAGFLVAPQGRLWNARLLPFYYLSLYVLAAIGVGYVGRTIATLVARDPRRPTRGVLWATAAVGLVGGLLVVAVPLRALPEQVPFTDIDLVRDRDDGKYQWAFLPATSTNSFVDSWARWNYEGFERKSAYPEYHGIVTTMEGVGEQYGCGRAMWEHEETHDRYGTPMALMLLPFWTDGCIGSMEGLYFESSSTTPYHFIVQDQLSSAPSNAQRDLPYVAGAPSRAEFDQGVAHLQMLGVRYYMAISDRMIGFAGDHPSLTEVAASGPWRVYEVADSALVTPLANEPAVLTNLRDDGKGWLEVSMDWYMDTDAWAVPLTKGGPEEWQRVAPGGQPVERPLAPVTVTDVEAGTDSISFDVDRTGVPVVVKASYFPNWKVEGGEGPWRITPNLMVVVPTSTSVELHYGVSWVEALAWGLTLIGVIGWVWLWGAPPVTMPRRREAASGDRTDPAHPAGEGPTGGRGTVPAAEFDPAEVIVAATERPETGSGPPTATLDPEPRP
jgi:fumarate reductase subunit C